MRFGCCLLLACPLTVIGAPPKHPAPFVVADRYRPFLTGQQKLTGLLANRIRANIEGYLEQVDAETVSNALATAQDKNSGIIPQLGTLLNAGSAAYENSRDPRLKSAVDRIATRLLQTQDAGGYLGAYENVREWTARDFAIHRGDIPGLLAYYRITKSLAAFTAAGKLGDSLVTDLESDANKNSSLVYLLEPMAFLYRYTADPRFLEFARRIARPLATAAAVHASPTEQGLSELIGFAELYRLTGDASLLDAASTGWKELRDSQVSIAGTVVTDLHSNDLGTQCAVAAWFELTLDLLRLTGNARYGNELEQNIYNALLAAQDPRTGYIASSVSLSGPKVFENGLANCLPCEAFAIANLPSATWGRYGRHGIALIQYSGGRVVVPMSRRETLQIFSEGSFPESGEILLHVDPSHSLHFPLLLRVPDWAARFVVDSGGDHLFGKPGEFLALDRDWHRGDTVKISMDLAVRFIRGEGAFQNRIAIQRGPQLLAFARAMNPKLTDGEAIDLASDESDAVRLTPADNALPPNWPGDQAYSIAGKIGEKTETLTLLPFADALSGSVWLRKPRPAHA